MSSLPRTLVTYKQVGETPLVALERARTEHQIPRSIPLAYAGRLDPMAEGLLLILVGDECKQQSRYHALDKEYVVEILLGASSDTGDVLGLISCTNTDTPVTTDDVRSVLKTLRGPITLPYPHFSSKTVRGKPLHTWTLEGRLDEIAIPEKKSHIYKLSYNNLRTLSRTEILAHVREKIETIPTVTDVRKALGEDFRRDAVRASWNAFEAHQKASYQILTITCIASSGTYMRSLAAVIARALGTTGLAYSIRRTVIGRYTPLIDSLGFWRSHYRGTAPFDSR